MTSGAPNAAHFHRETSPDAVARYIRALIVSGTLRRGERVPRNEIAETLEVSPVPVREAIIALDREGWLRIEPHRGAFVHGVDEAWISDHYELMGDIVALIAARASERATDQELQDVAAIEKRLARERDVGAFEALNEQLTRALIASAHAPRLEAALRGVQNIVPGNFFAEVPGSMESQRRGMHKTIRATVARDAATAAAHMRALPASQAAAVVKLLRERGVLDTGAAS